MKIVLCTVGAIFGVLSMIASVSQLKHEKKPIPAAIMTVGSFILIAAIICNIMGQWFDFIIALLGSIAICAAAIWNGTKSKQFHIQHHIIRIVLSAVLVIGFFCL